MKNEFIPKNIVKKKRIVKGKEYVTDEYGYYSSIQLNKIVALKLSEVEFKHVIKFLNDNNIRVGGTISNAEIDFDGYDFVRTYKDSNSTDVLPKTLSHSEQHDLLLRYSLLEDKSCCAGEEIRNRLIETNMRLVSLIAAKYAGYTKINKHELESYGYEGLIYAIEHYDINKGFKFSTYAYPCIRGFILRGVMAIHGFKYDWLYSSFIEVKSAVEISLSDDYGRKVCVEDDPKILDVVIDYMLENWLIQEECKPQIYFAHASSLDDLIEKNPEAEIPEVTCNNVEEIVDDRITRENLRNRLYSILDTLTEREKDIIYKLYGLDGSAPLTQIEVGTIYDISGNRIGQIHAKALQKLRHPSRSKKIKEFL